MEYSLKYKFYGNILTNTIESYIPNKTTQKDILSKYQRVIKDSKEIGSRNQMVLFYALSAYYIAMNKCDNLTAEENYHILAGALQNDWLFRTMVGTAKSHLSEKALKKRASWAKQTRRRRYQNDWVVDVLPCTDEYDVGYDFLACGSCKLCKAENCPELTHYLCNLHYLLLDFTGIQVDRTTTLAQGFKKCDFRLKKPS